MFVIRQQQLDAFRLPRREGVRQRAMADIRGDDFEVDEQPDGRSFVCRDERGAATTFAYSDRLLPQTIVKPLGQRYELAHDADGRLTKLQYPGGEQVELARDPTGLLTRFQTAPDTAFAFDYRHNHLARITYPGGAARQFGYDAKGLLSILTDRNGQTRRYVRDELDGKLLGVVDELGRATQFVFEDGYLAGIIFPDQSRQAVAYDEDDDSVFITLRDGKGFLQSYDGELLRELSWQDGPWTRFTHDADGRPQTIRTPDSLVTFGYGERGLVRETGELGSSELTYDASGQLAGVQLPAGLAVQYGYDLNDRLSYLDIGGQRIRYEYGPNDLLTAVRYPNGLRHELTHQHLGGLQRARLTGTSGRVLSEQTYHYDRQQRLTGLADPVAQQRSQLRYDNESHLLAVSDESAGTVREHFSYDAAGSLSSLNGWPVLTGPMGEIRQVGPDVWQYDALGNATRLRGPLGMLELDFARNSTLRRLRINGELWHYTYDGLGRRIGKTNGRERWQFGWLEGRLVAESYQPTAQAPLRLRHYLYHPDSFTPAAFVEEGQLFVMLADARGAVTHVYDPAGQLVWQGQYSAYGTCTEIVSQVRQSFRLAGQWADSESGLHYNLGRYYAPFVGSYLSVDPRWLDTLDTHPYAYARCDPYGRQDPLGDIAPLLIAVGGAALVGGVVSAGITAWQGGSWRQIGASFAHGALAGAGGAVGAMLGGLPGALLLGGVGSFLGSLVEQAINGEELCFGCAAKDALMDGLFAGLFAGLGKLLGPVLGRLGRAIAGSRMGQAIGRAGSKALAAAKAGIRRAGQEIRRGVIRMRGVPQGLSRKQFDEVGRIIRQGRAGEISDDIVVQGSRANGTAKPSSDMDVAVRVSDEEFDRLIKERFGTPNPGSAKERTMQHAIRTGKIQAGEAGLSPTGKALKQATGRDVDISVIRRGGPFDNGPFVEVPKP